MLKVLAVHNYYHQRGGEDRVFEDEVNLLKSRGHRVSQFIRRNSSPGQLRNPRAAAGSVWSRSSFNELRALLRSEQPDVMHLHNTLPLISPSAVHAARAERIATVQTLHNYRIFCPNGMFFRQGRPCEDCLGKFLPWPGILHSCYRQSRTATTAVASMLATHRAIGTWSSGVSRYIALSEFSRSKHIEGGLPASKIAIKPNFVLADPGEGRGEGGFALYVGRLSPEKGLRTLMRTWEQVGSRLPLYLVGDGPLRAEVSAFAAGIPSCRLLGPMSGDQTLELIGAAAALIVPSECYEGFPRVIVEALAKGTPIVASEIGGLGELVTTGHTGIMFRPGDATDLLEKVEWLIGHPGTHDQMRSNSRTEYELKYSAEENYRTLLSIYDEAIECTR